jgi:FkbM family methyltransferase
MMTQPIYDIWRILDFPYEHTRAEIRGHCQNAYLGNHTSLARVLGRYKMFLDTRDLDLAPHLLIDGYWEIWVTAAMMRTVRRGSVVADIGANFGYFSLLMADLVGPDGRVLCFEPNPDLVPLLTQTMGINNFGHQTTIHPVAVGAHAGHIQLEMNGSHIGSARPVIDDRKPTNSRFKKQIDTRITMSALDDIPNAMNLDFIKMDVEGFEYEVWLGMQRILDQNKPLTIFMEFTIDRLANARGFLEEILDRGFALEIIDYFNGIIPITVDALFDQGHNIDHMLVFKRGD